MPTVYSNFTAGQVRSSRSGTDRQAGTAGTLSECNAILAAHLEQRTQQVRELAAELALAEARERSRLAQVLHDDLQQQLFSVQFALRAVSRSAGEDKAVRSSVAQTEARLKEAIRIARDITTDLGETALAQGTLSDTLLSLVHHMRERHGLKVSSTVPDAITPVGEPTRVVLLSTVRELLFNIVKHAGVEEARVTLTESTAGLEITVSDQGCGFDSTRSTAQRRGSGCGLSGLQRRLKFFGADIRVGSYPGQGSTITLRMPLPQNEIGARREENHGKPSANA